MTWKQLSDAILSLPPVVQGHQARVFPPGRCPANESVAVTELSDSSGEPLLLTGKSPPDPAPGTAP